MVSNYTVLLCIAANLPGLYICSSELDRKYPIVMSHVLMNRGESLYTLPSPGAQDNFIDQDFPSWNPSKLEQITNKGIKNQFKVGKWVRKRYDCLLHARYWKPDIYALSADTDSCISSAQATMAGIFPPVGVDYWVEGLDWQPTPVHTMTSIADNKLLMNWNCPIESAEELYLKENNLDYAHVKNRLELLTSYLSFSMGHQVSESQLSSIYKSLYTQEKYNMSLPKWSKAVYPHPLKHMMKKLFVPPVATDNTKKYKSGVLLEDITSHMVDKVSGMLKPDRKIWLYSGEDDYISYMIQTLSVNMTSLPHFSDLLLVELRRSTQIPASHYVTIMYKRLEDQLLYLKMDGCDVVCPLEEFQRLVEIYRAPQWKEDCGLAISSALSSKQDALNAILAFSGHLRRFITQSSARLFNWFSSVL